MNLTGRYDFEGFKKLGGAGLFLLLASNPSWGWLTRGIGGKFIFGVLDFFTNLFLNKLLAGINVLAVAPDTEKKKEKFDEGFEVSIGLSDTEKKAGPLTPERINEINDLVRNPARKFLRLTKSK